MVPTVPGCDACQSCDVSVFGSLNHAERKELSRFKSYSYFKRGEALFREGSETSGLFCIYDGKVKITKMGPDGREQIFRLARPASILGFGSLLSGRKHSNSAVALENTFACFFPKNYCEDLLARRQTVAANASLVLVNELRQAERMILAIGQKNVRARVAETLLILENTYGLRHDHTINITFRREDIANMSATTTESAIRILAGLANEKVLALSGKKIRILNKDRLARLARGFSKK